MIKMDVISGFLGAGKTTLIQRYLAALAGTGEKVVVIENDFGSIGIDKRALGSAGLEVVEINHGCLCCSLRGNFVSALKEIAEEIGADRVVIEPSGIFILSEIFDFFTYPSVETHYILNRLIAIVDAVHYQEEKRKFGLFFSNQLAAAQALVLSKTGQVPEEKLLSIVEELSDEYPGRDILARDWEALEDQDMLNLFHSGREGDREDEIRAQAKRRARDVKRERGLHGFASCSFRPTGVYSAAELEHRLKNLPQMGDILRAKGFLFGGDVQWEFQYVNGSYQIKAQKNTDAEPAVCFIGRDLGREALEAAFA